MTRVDKSRGISSSLSPHPPCLSISLSPCPPSRIPIFSRPMASPFLRPSPLARQSGWTVPHRRARRRGGDVGLYRPGRRSCAQGDTQLFDRPPTNYFHDHPGSRELQEAGRDITALGGVAVLTLMVAAVVGYLMLTRKYAMMVFVIIATLGGLLLTVSLKHVIDRDRPPNRADSGVVYTQSLPTGHTPLSASTYFTLGGLLGRNTQAPAGLEVLFPGAGGRPQLPDRVQPNLSWRALPNRRAGGLDDRVGLVDPLLAGRPRIAKAPRGGAGGTGMAVRDA